MSVPTIIIFIAYVHMYFIVTTGVAVVAYRQVYLKLRGNKGTQIYMLASCRDCEMCDLLPTSRTWYEEPRRARKRVTGRAGNADECGRLTVWSVRPSVG